MLDLLRKNSRSFVVYLMFAIIIVVFAFTFGAITPDQACGGGAGPYQVADLATVDGQVIDTNLLNMVDELSFGPPSPNSKSPRAAEAERYYRQTRYGGLRLIGPFSGALFGRDPVDVSPIKVDKLLDELVETKLLAAYARELGMSITNREMSDRLALLVDGFKDSETGAFDDRRWTGYLRNQLGATPSAFEAFVKDELLRERVIQLLVGAMAATDAEVAQRHRLTSEKVKVEYVAVDKRSAMPLLDVPDADVKAWLGANEDKAKAKYEELKATKYTTPKRWTLRGIKLAAVDPITVNATDEQQAEIDKARAEVKARAEALKAEVEAAITAAKAAPAPAAAAGGADAAPAEPIDASAVFARFATERSEDEATKGQGGLFPQPLDTKALARPPFGIPVIAEVGKLEVGGMTGVVAVADGFWLLFADDIDDVVVADYGAVAMEIGRDILREEQVEAALEGLAGEVLAAAKADPTKPLSDAATAVNAKHGVVADGEGLKAAEAMPFARLSSFGPGYPLQLPYIFGIGKSPEIVRGAFAASADAPLLDQVFTVEPDGKKVIVRFLEGTAAEELDDDGKQALARELTLDKQRSFYRAWYQDLLAKKKKAGDVVYTDAWAELRQQAVDAYRSAGGVLSSDAPAKVDAEETTEASAAE